MPNYEDELRERTFKGEFAGADDEIERRVYHTLAGDRASDGPKKFAPELSPTELHLHLHRLRRLVAMLAAQGVRSGAITDDALDEMLFLITR